VIVNGTEQRISVEPGLSLARVLRERLGITSVKLACERGECGSCTVLHGDLPVMSCVFPAQLVREPVTTVDGLAEESRALREELAERGGFQCGYCTPGQVVHGVALLRAGLPDDPEDARDHVRRALAGNICRCTGYVGIVEALIAASGAGEGGASAS
jgi:aerobic-type carbon monoxide dehydrogenase small subunit (CoxS/CutS family)